MVRSSWRRLGVWALLSACSGAPAKPAQPATSAGPDAPPPDQPLACESPKVRVGEGCCWPQQEWQGKCSGAPMCPEGLLPAGDDCTPPAKHQDALVATCSLLDPGNNDYGAKQRACVTLTKRLDEVQPKVTMQCDASHPAECSVLGASLQSNKLVLYSIYLLSPPCQHGSVLGCAAQLKLEARLPFAAPRKDAAGAKKAFTTACQAKHGPSCLELAEIQGREPGSDTRKAHKQSCLEGNMAASCAKLVYEDVTSQVIDEQLMAAAGRVLVKGCDAGDAMACNVLGFGQEHAVIKSADPMLSAGASYARACKGDVDAGCANLIYLGVKQPKVGPKLPVAEAGALERLDKGCQPKHPIKWYSCFARGLALKRGIGTARRPQDGTKILGELCRAGHSQACGR